MKGNKNKRTALFGSLVWRIGIVFLSILLLLSAVYVYIAAWTAEMYYQEAVQKLGADIAPHIAKENQCFVNGEANEEVLKQVFHDVMIINPSIEVYLLDLNGKILTYYAPDKKIVMDHIPLEPVNEFIETGGGKMVMGHDPKNEQAEKTFSAAEVYEDSVHKGYIYVILEGEQYENVSHFLFGSYIVRLAVRSIAITFIAAAIISILALTVITRNIRSVVREVRKFKEGDLSARIEIKGRSELNEFGDAFNEMADTIVQNIEEMKTMDNLRRELVANVSHDLRTPLATIQGYIETIMMKADTLSEEEKGNYMNTIFSSTERLKNLVSELFELSRLEAREKKPQPESFSIAELVQDIQQKNLVIAKPLNIGLKLEFSPELPLVYADIGMMEKVLQNLLDNAIKFTGENGTVTISMEQEDNCVVINVSDTGSGISEDELPHIFNRYQQADRGEVEDSRGLGLGLAIVKKILEVHDIQIDVQSREGVGTTFTFKVPVYEAAIKEQSELKVAGKIQK